jgi:hypothetical protein
MRQGIRRERRNERQMRQLSIGIFLAIIALFGVYYLVTQALHLSFYYAPPATQFPMYRVPAPLPSITPGPSYKNEFNSGPSTSRTLKVPASGFAVHHPPPVARVTPVPIAAPTMNAVTPMPAPTFAAVTPPPLTHTPPAITVPGYGTVAAPTPSPSPKFPGYDRSAPSPTASARFEPYPSGSASPAQASPQP